MGKGKDNSQQSQAESSMKRLMKKLRKKDKDKPPTVEPKKPVESPKPDVPAPPVAVATSFRRPKKRPWKPRKVNKGRRHRSWSDYNNFEDDPEAMPRDREPCPKRTWMTTSQWSIEALWNASVFLHRYAEMGVEGMKEEFKKEIEGYKTPNYVDTQWKANPTKNRDKDQMTCLEVSRVEFDDKKRYINASWVYDTQLVRQKYILTQVPIVPQTEGAESTLDDFWEMINKWGSVCIIYFREAKEAPREDTEKGPFGKVVHDKFYPVRENAQLELSTIFVANRGRVESRYFWSALDRFGISPIKCPVEDNHMHKEIAKKNLEGVKGCLSHYHSTLVSETDSWSEIEVQDQLYTIAQVQGEVRSRDGTPIVLMDDFSGTSRAAIFVAVDVLGSLLFSEAKDVTMAMVVKWIRRCRNGAIRNADEYVFIFNCLFRQICQYPGLRMTEKVKAMWKEIVDEEKRKDDAFREEKRKEEEKKAEEKAIKDEKERKEREKAEKAEQERQEQLREASEKKKKKKKFPFF